MAVTGIVPATTGHISKDAPVMRLRAVAVDLGPLADEWSDWSDNYWTFYAILASEASVTFDLRESDSSADQSIAHISDAQRAIILHPHVRWIHECNGRTYERVHPVARPPCARVQYDCPSAHTFLVLLHT